MIPLCELEFQTEVEIRRIAVHKNLLPLVGFCMTSAERILVYPFMANKSLCTYLRGCTPNVPLLDWCTRKRIAVGAAQGLSYLHEQVKSKIIHRDVKPSNILLNDEFESVICDFGLAKIIDCKNQSASTNRICGTFGYMAPEYAMAGKFSDKTDVYGYGVTLLELITARRIHDGYMNSSDEGALSFVKRMLKEKDFDTIVDPRLGGNYKRAEVMEHLRIAFLCMNRFPEKRPKMSWVVWILKGEGLAGRADDEIMLELVQVAEQFSVDEAVACNNIPSLCQEGMQLEEDTIETSGEESKKAEVEIAQDQRISEGVEMVHEKIREWVQWEVEVAQNQIRVSPSSCFNAINSRKCLNPFEDCISEGERTNLDVFHDDGVLKISGESWGKISVFDNDSENIEPSGLELRSLKATESTSRGKMKGSIKAKEDNEQGQHHRDKSAVGFNDECHALEQNMRDKNEDGQMLDVVYQEDEQVPERNCGSEAHFDASSFHAHDPCYEGSYNYPGWVVF